MPTPILCQHCQAPLPVLPKVPAPNLRCPKCKAPIAVPSGSAPVEPARTQPALPPSLGPTSPSIRAAAQPLRLQPAPAARPAGNGPGAWSLLGLVASGLLCVSGAVGYLVVPEGGLRGPGTQEPLVAEASKPATPEEEEEAPELPPTGADERSPTPPLPREKAVLPRPTLPKEKRAPKEEKKPAPVKGPPEEKAKPEEAKEPPRPFAFTMKRQQNLDAEELRKQLLTVPEVALDAVPDTAKGLVTTATNLRTRNLAYPGPVLLTSQRLDLAGLDLRMGQDCQLGDEPAKALQVLSRKLRVHLEAAVKAGDGLRPKPDKLRELLLSDDKHEWLKPEAVPALMQLLQAENAPVRKLLVELLGQIKGKQASQALAIRALSDLGPEVRERATLELRNRPHAEFVPTLQNGLHYPWAPVAQHAAETIAALRLQQTIPAIVQMLDQPDSTLPFNVRQGRGQIPVVRELVRVNHLGNCILCHAPSSDRGDLVRGAVPTRDQPLPAPATTPSYYERGGSFVRADVTYLRQDFSVVQPVDPPGKWPLYQRFDYVVRLRPLTPAQRDFLVRQAKGKKMSEQKQSMLFALRQLTGKDLGTTARDWQPVLPPQEKSKLPAIELVTGKEDWKTYLPKAKEFPARGTAEAKRLRQQNTEALAKAIPALKGAEQEKARAGLARRLSGLSGAELAERLQDDLAEVRRAAAQACADDNDKTHLPGLIALVKDREVEVAHAAGRALSRLTGQDFGPRPDDGAEARGRAAEAWSSWWKKQLGR